ncbi:MAG: hypothetical protein NTW86_16640 [Candidatus Sumerlaeota bacterium]|nr:hypothetical protein [Candidatus Sumerlaeota bacterium]
MYKKCLDEWAAAFPRQLVCLHMSKTANQDEDPNPFVEKIVAYAMEHYPTQFALQNNGLNGRKEEYQDENHPLVKHRSQLINGMQSLDSFLGKPERQGSVEMSVLNFIHMDAEYWELWTRDGNNLDFCKQLTDTLAEARAMGYEAYKQKLIDAGQYRKAEDDTWPQQENLLRQQLAAKQKNAKKE